MQTTKKTIRLNDAKILNYIKNESSRRNIPQTKFINECIERCMKNKSFKDEFEIKLDKLMKTLNIAINSLKEINAQNNYINKNSYYAKNLSLVGAAVSLILLDGKINEYERDKKSWENIYTRNYDILNSMDGLIDDDLPYIMKMITKNKGENK